MTTLDEVLRITQRDMAVETSAGQEVSRREAAGDSGRAASPRRRATPMVSSTRSDRRPWRRPSRSVRAAWHEFAGAGQASANSAFRLIRQAFAEIMIVAPGQRHPCPNLKAHASRFGGHLVDKKSIPASCEPSWRSIATGSIDVSAEGFQGNGYAADRQAASDGRAPRRRATCT